MTKTVQIKMNNFIDIKNFVSEASKAKYDVDCRRGRHSVDGSSLMGVIFIDATQGMSVEYDDRDKAFEDFLKDFTI